LRIGLRGAAQALALRGESGDESFVSGKEDRLGPPRRVEIWRSEPVLPTQR